MTVPVAPVNTGDVLAGKYRVERVLGQGNMGVVVAATHVDLGHKVALKFLLSAAQGQGVRERFLREARAVVSLKSQHITRVSDVGTLETGAPYMVMELLEGQDLGALLEQSGVRPIPEAVEYVLQACEAVGEAHRSGIIHRDLKPPNLFLTTSADGSPCVKVFDFGVSKLLGDSLKLTSEGQTVGSPLYMSLEQMQAKSDLDARSDIWALGVILYELLAGRTPFEAQTIMALYHNVLTGAPVPITQWRPDVPPALEAAILRCFEKDREQRWQNAAAFAAAIAPFGPPRAQVYAERVAAVVGVPPPTAEVSASLSQPSPAPALGSSGSGVLLASSAPPAPLAPPLAAPVLGSSSGAAPASAPPTSAARWPVVLLVAFVAAAVGAFALRSPGTAQPAVATSATTATPEPHGVAPLPPAASAAAPSPPPSAGPTGQTGPVAASSSTSAPTPTPTLASTARAPAPSSGPLAAPSPSGQRAPVSRPTVSTTPTAPPPVDIFGRGTNSR